jgi:hypothetical protein
VANSVTASLFVGDLSGNASTATKATYDESGNNIKNTYVASITSADVDNGTRLTVTKGNNSNFDDSIIIPNDKVYTQSSATGTLYLTGTLTDSSGYTSEYFHPGVNVNLTNGNVTAPKFIGALSGIATNATKATQDAAGNNIQ